MHRRSPQSDLSPCRGEVSPGLSWIARQSVAARGGDGVKSEIAEHMGHEGKRLSRTCATMKPLILRDARKSAPPHRMTPGYAAAGSSLRAFLIQLSKNQRQASAFPLRDAPGVCTDIAPRKQRAQGKPGARRTRSLACKVKQAHERSHHRYNQFNRPSPRNGFNGLFRALPGDRAFLPPSPALLIADLTPASGRQDHTSSPSAASRQASVRPPKL